MSSDNFKDNSDLILVKLSVASLKILGPKIIQN